MRRELHSAVETRLKHLLDLTFPDSKSISEVGGVLGGRNDLIQFFYSGRRVVFEVFASQSQVPQDLRLLEQCDAQVKIAVLLDWDVDRQVSTELFRKRPNHFPFLWVSQVLDPRLEPLAIARLRELIDEGSAVRLVRRLVASPSGSAVEQKLADVLRKVEASVRLARPASDQAKELTAKQVVALQVLKKFIDMGVPIDHLRSLYAYLIESLDSAYTLVLGGFQAFLVTDLNGGHGIWSDGDLADDLIMGAESSDEPNVIVCLNKYVNDLIERQGLSRSQLKWHFFHTYVELVGQITPAFTSGPPGGDDPQQRSYGGEAELA